MLFEKEHKNPGLPVKELLIDSGIAKTCFHYELTIYIVYMCICDDTQSHTTFAAHHKSLMRQYK